MNDFLGSQNSELEWLLKLERDPQRYKDIYVSYGLLGAAHKLARAKCVVNGRGVIPTAVEVYSAAREIESRAQVIDYVPSPQTVRNLCEVSGLPVI